MDSRLYKRVIFCKRLRIYEEKYGSMENGQIKWLCHTQKNSTAVGGQMMKVKAHEMALILKASELDGDSGSKTDRTLHGNQGAQKVPKEVPFGRVVARMCDTNHYSVHPEGYV
jgi:hypothetical protein